MSLPSPAHLPERGLPPQEAFAVSKKSAREQLSKILQSTTFRDAEGLKHFLQYSVEHTLQGEGGQLKEYRLGVDVFHRTPSFDPRLDPVVRMAARRLRNKLEEYYDREGRNDPIRIDIPKGTYSSTFTANTSEHSPRLAASCEPSLPENRKDAIVESYLRLVASVQAATSHRWTSPGRLRILVGLVAAITAIFAIWLGFFSASPRVSSAQSVAGKLLIAEVTNRTGESVFDDTLKQAIAVGLSQSPQFEIVSDSKVRATLKLMSRPTEMRITPDLAREVCQRSGSDTYIDASIRPLGQQYVIGLKAVNCETGDTLAQEQVAANGKEQVLKAMDQASENLRQRLGESLSTIQKYDVPLEQATTPSLDALKAYSLGNTARDRRGDAATVSFFNRADRA